MNNSVPPVVFGPGNLDCIPKVLVEKECKLKMDPDNKRTGRKKGRTKAGQCVFTRGGSLEFLNELVQLSFSSPW